jgi:hypothetical protein
MNMWIIPPGISLTRAQIDEALSKKRSRIQKLLKSYSELRAYLRFNMAESRWDLIVTDMTSEPCIFIDHSDSHNSVMEKLVKMMDAEQRLRDARAKTRFGYVIGNRHNYLFELCQAFKEAGYIKQKAKHEIEQWARKHRDDEERGYIADLVYGDETDVMTERVHECKECWRKWLKSL